MKGFNFQDKIAIEEELRKVEASGTFPYYQRKFPWLNKKNETLFIDKAKAGDAFSRKVLLFANLSKIVQVAEIYSQNQAEVEDLIQAGMVGFFKALIYYDTSSNYAFASFSLWYIRSSMFRNVIQYRNAIALPEYVILIFRKIDEIGPDLAMKLGRTPTVEDYADLLEMPVQALKKLYHSFYQEVSLESLGEDNDAMIDDTIEDPWHNIEQTESEQHIHKVLMNLPKREQYVLEKSFLDPATKGWGMEKIGETMQTSRETVRKLKIRGLKRMGEYLA